MIRDAYNKGRAAALARFKLSNLNAGAQGYNPTLNGQAPGGASHNALTAPPASAAAPMAAGAAKSQVLG